VTPQSTSTSGAAPLTGSAAAAYIQSVPNYKLAAANISILQLQFAMQFGIPLIAVADLQPVEGTAPAPDGALYFLNYILSAPIGYEPFADAQTELNWSYVNTLLGTNGSNAVQAAYQVDNMLAGDATNQNFDEGVMTVVNPIPAIKYVPPAPPPPPAPTDPVGPQFSQFPPEFVCLNGDTTPVGGIVQSPSHGNASFLKMSVGNFWGGQNYFYVPAPSQLPRNSSQANSSVSNSTTDNTVQ
jgi:hypothetical protein